MSVKLYVYRKDDNMHVATIIGNSNLGCEGAFLREFDSDFESTYSPAFGYNGGIIENKEAEEIKA